MEAGHQAGMPTPSLTDLPPSLLRLILARMNLHDVRSLLRTCTAMMEFFDDVEAQAVWLARNRPEQAVRLAVRAKCPDAALHLLDNGLKADTGSPGGTLSVLQEACGSREAPYMGKFAVQTRDNTVIEPAEAAWGELVARLCQPPRWVRRGGQWRLEDNSSDLGARTDHGDTVLHLAAARGKWGAVEALVREQPDLLTAVNDAQQLPTEVAQGSHTMVALLKGLKQKADSIFQKFDVLGLSSITCDIDPKEIDAQSKKIKTEYEQLQKQVLWALVWACQAEEDSLPVLEELAKDTPKGRSTLSMCDLGISSSIPGATLSQLKDGYMYVERDSPLHVAVKAGEEEVVEFLLRTWHKDIDFNAKNSKGELVHHVARNARVVVMLQEAEEKQEAGKPFGDDNDEEEEDEFLSSSSY